MGALLGRLTRTGLSRGLRDGSRAWLYVGLGAATTRLVIRLLVPKPETVFSGEIKPGERLEIRAFRPSE